MGFFEGRKSREGYMGTTSLDAQYAAYTDGLKQAGVRAGLWPSPSTLARRLRRSGYQVLLNEPPKKKAKEPPPGE